MRIRRDPVTVIGDETHGQPLAREPAGKAWGVGRSESQETCPDAGTSNRSSREDLGVVTAPVASHARRRAERQEPLRRRPGRLQSRPHRIRRHRPDLRRRHAGASRGIGRSGPGWLTVEEPLDLADACRRLAPQLDLIVVDCLTVWVANLMDRGDDDAAVLAAADELAALLGERVVSLIVVSNEVGEGVHPPTEIGLRFRDLLGSVNQRIAAAADLVTLMVAGIPVPVKRAAARATMERAW